MKLLPVLKKVLILQIPIILVFGLGYFLRTESEFFVIEKTPIEVEFKNEQKSLVESLRPELNQVLLSLKGANIWKVSLADMQSRILENPWVEEVEIRRRFPNQISTLVRFNEVAFLYLDKKNRVHPVTTSGERLGRANPLVVPVAPILRNKKLMKDKLERKKIIAMLDQVPNLGALRKENIALVDYNSVTGLTLKLISGDETVHLGEKNISTKGLQVLRVTDYLKSQKQKARVIDASFTKKVLVRLRKRS